MTMPREKKKRPTKREGSRRRKPAQLAEAPPFSVRA